MNAQFESFLTQMLATGLWSTSGDDGEPLDDNHGVEDFAPNTLEGLRADALSFWNRMYYYLDQETPKFNGNRAEMAGHDFWLTRCGHGAGFWDGDWPVYGKTLTTLSQFYGNVDLYVGDDGLIYC